MPLLAGEQRAPGGVVDPDGRQVVVIDTPISVGAVTITGPLDAAGFLEVAVQNQLIPAEYDEIDLSYTGSNLTTVLYKRATVLVATLTLSYTGSNLTSVVRT